MQCSHVQPTDARHLNIRCDQSKQTYHAKEPWKCDIIRLEFSPRTSTEHLIFYFFMSLETRGDQSVRYIFVIQEGNEGRTTLTVSPLSIVLNRNMDSTFQDICPMTAASWCNKCSALHPSCELITGREIWYQAMTTISTSKCRYTRPSEHTLDITGSSPCFQESDLANFLTGSCYRTN